MGSSDKCIVVCCVDTRSLRQHPVYVYMYAQVMLYSVDAPPAVNVGKEVERATAALKRAAISTGYCVRA